MYNSKVKGYLSLTLLCADRLPPISSGTTQMVTMETEGT